jgi:hypothetical protein
MKANPEMPIAEVISKLPEELKLVYKCARKGEAVVEALKVAAALKFWNDRGYRELGFEVPSDLGGKTFYVDVIAQDARGFVGVECAPTVEWERLRKRVALLRGSLPPDSHLVLVFPANVGEQAKKATKLVDEVWVTGKNNTVETMMFMSVFHKE